LNRSILACLAVATLAGLPATAWAQDRTGAPPKTETAPKPAADTRDKPAADTREPGKTATEAVTNPAAVPPTEGAVGSGKPPSAGAPPAADR